MKDFFQNHTAVFSIIIVSLIGFTGFFIDTNNSWYHWSWLAQVILIFSYIALEIIRYKKNSLTVKERFKRYLLDYKNWEETEENTWHYKPDPDFMVLPTPDKSWEVLGGENWVRAAINPKSWVRPMQLMYRNTVVFKCTCIYFDEMRQIIPAPKVTGMIGPGDKWYYSLCTDYFDAHLLPLLTHRSIEEIISDGQFSSRGSKVPVIIFSSETEKSRFEIFLTQKPVEGYETNQCMPLTKDPIVKDVDKQIIAYSRVILKRLEEFREIAH